MVGGCGCGVLWMISVIPFFLLYFVSAEPTGGSREKGDSRLLPGPTSHENDFENSGLIFQRRRQRDLLERAQQPTGGRDKGDFTDLPIDLLTEESRKKNRRQSYHHRPPPRNKHYQSGNKNSKSGKNGKGGYHKSDSYNGNSGYSTSQDYSRANKDSYGDESNKKFGGHNGGNYGGGSSGGGGGRGYRGGGGLYSHEYGDDGRSYTRADEY